MHGILKNGSYAENIDAGDVAEWSYEADAAESTDFRFGGAVPAALNFTLFTETGKFNNFKFSGASVEAYDDDDVKLGTFYVNSAPSSDYSVAVESLDGLTAADTTWQGTSSASDTLWDVYTSVLIQCGFTSAFTAAEYPCAALRTDISALQGKTCRELLRYLAEAAGMFCVMDAEGHIAFRKYNFSGTAEKITRSDISDLSAEEIITQRKGVQVQTKSAVFSAGYTSESECVMKITENTLVSGMSDADAQRCAETVYAAVKDAQFCAATMKFWDTKNVIRLGTLFSAEKADGTFVVCAAMKITKGSELSVQSFGDTLESRATAASSAAAEESRSAESSSTEVFIGKGQNNVPIDVRAGEYVICEKEVNDVSRFTRVFLNFSVQFVLTAGKACVFSVCADGIKLKEIRFMSASDGKNTVSYGLTADTTSAQSTVYSLRAEVPAGAELVIDPFDAEISLIVKSGTITDTQATDQYFPEKWKRPAVSVLAWQKMRIGEVAEGEIKTEIPDVCVDVSAAQDGSILATATKEEKVLHIRGTGRMIDDLRNNIFKLCPGDAGRNLIMSCTKAVFHTGITYIGSYFLTYNSGNSFTEVRIEIANEFEVGERAIGNWNGENTKFKTIISHPEKIVKIADGGFCSANIYAQGFKLTGLTEIAGDAFKNNYNITGCLDIRNAEVLHTCCFRNCKGIESVFFHRSFKRADSGTFGMFNECIGIKHLYCDRRPEGGPEYGTGWNCDGAEQHTYYEKTKYTGPGGLAGDDFDFGILDKVVLGSGGYAHGEDGGFAYVENGEIKETSDYKDKGTQFYAAYSPSIDSTQSTPSS